MQRQHRIQLTVSTILLILSAVVTLQAHAQTAFFSLEGNFNIEGDQIGFDISLSRQVDFDELISFETFASDGGTNSAGDVILDGGGDSELSVRNGSGTIAADDDSSVGRFDSLLTMSEGDSPLPSPFPSGRYVVGVTDFDDEADPFAVDFLGPANAFLLNGFSPGGTATVSSLKFGTLSDGETASATLRNERRDLSIVGPLVVGQVGNARFLQTGGSTTVSGTTTVRFSDSLIVDAGTFNADGDINILNSGQFSVSGAGNLNANGDISVHGGTLRVDNMGQNLLAPGNRLTATNGGQVQTDRSTLLFAQAAATIESGANWTHTGELSVGSNFGNGFITVEGDGSTLDVSDTIELTNGGNRGVLIVKNNAQATSIALLLGRSLTANNTDAILNINTGGGLTTGSIVIGDIDGNRGTGTINLDGSGSSLNQTEASFLALGNIDILNNEGEHTINVTNGAVLSTGAGRTIISDTGTFFVDENSTANFNGDIFVDGGTLRVDNTGQILLAAGKTLTAFNGGQVQTANSSLFILEAQIESGADWTHTGALTAGATFSSGTVIVDGPDSTLNVNGLLELTNGGNRGVVNVQNNAQASSNQLFVGESNTDPTTVAELNIRTGGDLTTGTVGVGSFFGNQGRGTINLAGTGSSLTQNGNSFLLLGNNNTLDVGRHAVNVTDNAVFTTGTGPTIIRKTGTLTLNTGGKFITGGNFAPTGTIQFELESLSSFERIQVNGGATLGGDLVVETKASFSPTNGQTFELLDADGGISGEFDNVTFSGVPDGFEYDIQYTSNSVLLTVSGASILGDFDNNGDVDDIDIGFFTGNIGSAANGSLAQLDLDASGTIDMEDLRIHVETLVRTSNLETGALFGDADLDGTVDVLGDAFVLIGNLGSSGAWAQGDFNADGNIDVLGDAFALINNLGKNND